MPKPFDAASKHLIENRPIDWLRLSRLPLPQSAADVTIVDADLSNVMTTAGYHLIRVWELPPAAVMEAGVGVLPLAPITAVPEEELAPLLGAVKRQLDAEVPEQQVKEFLLAMRVLMGLKFDEHLTETLMQTIAEMTDSVEWQKIHQRGKAEGKAEGMIEGEQTILILQGTEKFGPPASDALQRIRETRDADGLRRLAVRLITASAWGDLFES
jgi:predicted transposase YdaD